MTKDLNVMNKTTSTYTPLTPTLLVQLAAPHTWPASVFPVLIATALAAARGYAINALMVCVLLAISVLFQSAVNTINDYFDYVKGADTLDNQADPTDAVLVYNNVNPASVRTYALVLVGAAFLLGVYCIVMAGWVPLVVAVVGAIVVFLYSGGKTPISYLPIGEVVSGMTMGGLISFASYFCLTLSADPLVFLWSVPTILGIALIMMTNNGCDIEKDSIAGRKTLPVVLGRDATLRVYHGIVIAWIVSIVAIVLVWFTKGWIVLPFMMLAVIPQVKALLANPLEAHTRAAAFAQCTGLNISLGAFYASALLASAALSLA